MNGHINGDIETNVVEAASDRMARCVVLQLL